MSETFPLLLNGEPIAIGGIDPNTTLLELVRDRGLLGTKEGCAEGDCGACTVAVRSRATGGGTSVGSGGAPGDETGGGTGGGAGWPFRAVNSCLVLAPSVAGQEVWTVEGLARDGALHPAQVVLAAAGGSQCGYCTPGFVMSLFTAYYGPRCAPDAPDTERDREIDDALVGNLCRCTGYRPIKDAARQLVALTPDARADRFLAAPVDAIGTDATATTSRVPTSYEHASYEHASYEYGAARYFRPARLDEALALLAAHPEARPVAGATDLGLLVTKGLQRFPLLVSLEGVAELTAIAETEDAWRVGAAVPLSLIGETLRGALPLIDQLLPRFASRQVRNRATIGGNLATASPIGDASPVLLALDARVRLAGPAGEREVPLDEYFTGYRRTVLEAGELVVAVLIPKVLPGPTPGTGAVRRLERFYKVAKRSHVDITTVSAAFVIDLDAENRIVRARLAYGGVAPTPRRAYVAERALQGRAWHTDDVAAGGAALEGAFEPISDHRGSASYRSALVGNLFARFCEEGAR